jgi:hypothetical protein
VKRGHLSFDVQGLEPAAVERAFLDLRGARDRRVKPGRVRKAARSGLRLKVKRPGRSTGELVVTISPISSPITEPAPEPEPEPEPVPVPAPAGACPGSGLIDLPGGCDVLLDDSGATADPIGAWGNIECASDDRHVFSTAGGDLAPTALGLPQASGYRTLTTIDGDDFYGERCELGRNDHRVSPTALYHEGERRLTYISYRLPAGFPISTAAWQVVMQMKQSQPSAGGGGTPVISLEVREGRWILLQSTSAGPSGDTRELWSAPAATGSWTRFAFDVTYSKDASLGSIRVVADLNGDGDGDDLGERSPVLRTYTLKYEIEGGSATDGIAPGESIPSHLRVGLYHNPSISCPAAGACSVDVDNVQVLAPR